MTNDLPNPAEAAAKLLPVRSRWFAWPYDLLANLLSLAAVLLAYLTVNALATRRRRRVALLLLGLAIAAPTIVRLLAG